MNRPTLLVFAIFALFQGPALAGTATAEKQLKTAIDEVLAVANRTPGVASLADNLTPVLQKHLSFAAMTRRAIGPGWRQFSNDEQAKAIQLFTTLVIRTYSSKITPGEHPAIQFKPATTPAPGRVDVPTMLRYKGSNYDVTYRMEQAEGWRVTDVVIEGVSLIANYRAQLDAQFKSGGANSVINALTQSVNRPQ